MDPCVTCTALPRSPGAFTPIPSSFPSFLSCWDVDPAASLCPCRCSPLPALAPAHIPDVPEAAGWTQIFPSWNKISSIHSSPFQVFLQQEPPQVQPLVVPGAVGWVGSSEFHVFLGLITLQLLVDAASEPRKGLGPLDLSPQPEQPKPGSQLLRNRHVPEPDPDFLSDSLKEKSPEVVPTASRAGNSHGLGCPCHLPPAADPSQSGLLEPLPPSPKPTDGCLGLNQDSPPGAGAASSPPVPHPGKEPPSLDLSCRTPLLAPEGCVAMEEALPWRPLPWRWRPAHPGEVPRPLPVPEDGFIPQLSLLLRPNTRR